MGQYWGFQYGYIRRITESRCQRRIPRQSPEGRYRYGSQPKCQALHHGSRCFSRSLYTCCEPIGPEHTPEEIVENFFIGIEIGCFQHAAMRRVAVPGVPLSKYGQITELRLAQIVAVITLATLNTKSMRYMSVHEPNQVGLLSGANVITAESGANPRDTNIDTSKGRGFSMANCRKMLFEAGFTSLRRGDESIIPLNLDYLKKTNSF